MIPLTGALTHGGVEVLQLGDRVIGGPFCEIRNQEPTMVIGRPTSVRATTNPVLNRRVYTRLEMTVPRVVTADDLRSQLGHELDLLRKSDEVLFVSKRGRLTAVLIDVERYRELVERAEFLEDSLAALKAREDADQAVPWSKVRN